MSHDWPVAGRCEVGAVASRSRRDEDKNQTRSIALLYCPRQLTSWF